ncbi:MAG: ATP-binding protein [Muribaculaceae bacterium]
MPRRAFIALIIMLFVMATPCHAATDYATAFDNISINSSSHTVYAMLHRPGGLLYIGTDTGLYTYDGYVCRSTASAPGAPSALHINAMVLVGSAIYTGSDSGINAYDTTTDSYLDLPSGLPANVRAIAPEPSGALLIGSFTGLYRYDPVVKTLTAIAPELSSPVVYAIAHDDSGNYYIGTYNGLYRLRAGEKHARRLPTPPRAANHFFVNALIYDRAAAQMIIGTEGALYRLDTDALTYTEIAALRSNSCKALTLDSHHRLWVGTDNGLYMLADDSAEPLHFIHDSRLASSIANNAVWSLLATDKEIIAGTDEGLSILAGTADFRSTPLHTLTGRGDGNRIECILRDSQGNLWLGGSNGIIRCDRSGASAAWYMVDSPQLHIPHNRIRDIFEDSRKRLWIASDGGVLLYDNTSGRFEPRHITSRDGKRNTNWAYCINEDADGNLRIASYLGGVMLANADKLARSAAPYIADEEFCTDHRLLPNNLTYRTTTDGAGNCYAILFRCGDIIKLDSKSHTSAVIPFESIVGSTPSHIIGDPHGAGVWVAHTGGVAHLAADGTVIARATLPTAASTAAVTAMALIATDIYIAADNGLWRLPTTAKTPTPLLLDTPAAPFSCIYYDADTRRIMLGGVDYIADISPDTPPLMQKPPSLSITDIEVNGNKYHAEQCALRCVTRLDLSHDQGNVAIRFSALDALAAPRIRYEYMLEGLSADWHLVDQGSNRIAFANLRPGLYTLKIRPLGTDTPDFVTTLVTIHIAQPWFWSWWAKTLYALIAAAALLYVLHRLRLRRRAAIERIERDTAMESVRRRIDFMTNISHEFKTPLSLIIGPLSHIINSKTPGKTRTELEGIYSQALALNGLVQRALESGRMADDGGDDTLIVSDIDIVELARGIVENYREAFAGKNFVFANEAGAPRLRLDVMKIESVLNNLLSNACKYSSDNATIALSIERIAATLRITVSDDGVGIPTSELNMVFQRLYQSSRTIDDGKGSGIGLFLVKKYVELHGGAIIADNNSAGGARFTITLPINSSSEADADTDASTTGAATRAASTPDAKVLIVDDNRDLRRFISGLLADSYECYYAANGRAGLAVLGGVTPDIIIADIMMPVMNGLEMARRIRSNPRFSQVPIILLSAKDDAATRAEVAAAGVTVFIPKPFEPQYLITQMRNLMANASNIRAGARRELIADPAGKDTPQAPDELMLAKIAEVIEANIGNADFSVAVLADSVGLQTKALYRLIKKYLGVTPVDYIRNMRLKRAATLLSDNKFTIAEVMYLVGFSSASYFSKCFSARYGDTPRQYREKRHADLSPN